MLLYNGIKEHALKRTNSNRKQEKNLFKIFDNLTLLSLLHYVSYRFLQSTMFPLVFSERYKIVTFSLLVVSGGIRFLYIIANKFLKYKQKDKKVKLIIQLFVFFVLSIPFVYVSITKDNRPLIFIPLTIICLYEMDAVKVLRSFVAVIIILFLSTVLCSLAGCVRNIIFERRWEVAGSYGIINTTDCAAYFFFILLCLWIQQRKESTWQSCLFFVALSILFGIGSFLLCRSQTTTVCCFLLGFFCLWEMLETKFFYRGKRSKWLIKGSNIIMTLGFPICAFVFAMLTYLYIIENPFAQKMDLVLSTRLYDTRYIFQKYGISLFGTMFVMHGNGGSMISDQRRYDFIDNSYSSLLFRNGLIVFLIVLVMWVWMTARVIKEKNRRVAYALLLIALYSASESHMLDINYNILIAMPLCSFKMLPKDNGTREKSVQISNQLFSFISAMVVIICIYVFLPRFLSCFRTLCYLKGWNNGLKSIYAFLFCAGIIVLLGALWYTIHLLWQRRKKRIVYIIICIVLVLGISAYIVNEQIDKAVTAYGEELVAEESVIRTVQSNATQPVYAAEKSELYQRGIGGFDETIMSVEDMCRKKEGTFFTDKSYEAMLVIREGGQYLQFSPQSGVYSFDNAVIDALEAEGYSWKPFYDSERNCNLADLAQLNNLSVTQNGGVILNGPNHSLSQNWFMDQDSGIYEVKYYLSIDPLSINQGNDKICSLQIMGYNGEELLQERIVTLSDFDEKGNAEIVIRYSVSSTPRMEYRAVAYEGQELIVQRITWRKVANESN